MDLQTSELFRVIFGGEEAKIMPRRARPCPPRPSLFPCQTGARVGKRARAALSPFLSCFSRKSGGNNIFSGSESYSKVGHFTAYGARKLEYNSRNLPLKKTPSPASACAHAHRAAAAATRAREFVAPHPPPPKTHQLTSSSGADDKRGGGRGA